MLGQEFKELHHGAPVDDSSLIALYQSIHRLEAAGQEPRAALCLSGGGIRSAAFGLGILQGLARHGLLLKFHYLSTVSGGGYIGSWLTAWRRHAANDKAVIESLTSRRADPPEEPPEIGSIRADSNYLTPRLGLLSADTWTAVSLYVRNLLLNWLVLVPMFAAGLLVPLVASRFLDWASCSPQAWRWVALALGLLLIGTGHTVAVASRPGEGRRGIDTIHFLLFVLLPVYGGATALAVFAAQGAGPLTGCGTVLLWPIADVLVGRGQPPVPPSMRSPGSSASPPAGARPCARGCVVRAWPTRCRPGVNSAYGRLSAGWWVPASGWVSTSGLEKISFRP